ncbi:MAG: ABC transporter ATP-binding protein [Oleibacter sp.]|nr:ABC transporter ATP-binding protein [Thalassolituus sp.]
MTSTLLNQGSELDIKGLNIADLSKSFSSKSGSTSGTTLAVDSVNFAVSPQQVCILLGPSGCGKSTILRMIAGLEQPTSGSIILNGKSIHSPGRDRGMVFQGYTSFPWLTVRENVAYGLTLNGDVSALREGTVDYFIEAVGLTKFTNHWPHQISGGMRQRVALARALAISPQLLLMDEPFGALDAETRWQMQELLLNVIRKERMTVVMVTHDVEEALLLGDQIVFLSSHPGQVKTIFTPPFKADNAISTRESLRSHPDFMPMEKEILQMMRSEGAH